jgi:protein-S-isoprenylcysteine O-methyltransferase Ste14
MVIFWKPVLFILTSLLIAWASRASLRNSQVHGFYRFFAFEAELGLVLLNLGIWFERIFSWWQIISWLLLIISLFLVLHGFYLLRKVGQPQGSFENTTHMVMVGAYRFIRHPLYASLFFLAWGVFFKLPSLAGLALAIAACGFLFATARVEEVENLKKFGCAYAEYMKKTSMFVPFLF